MNALCKVTIWVSSLSNTVEQIRPANGLTRLLRLVRPAQVVKQWFTSRTISELHRYLNNDDKQFCRIFFVLKAWEPESPSNDMQFTNCTTRKPLFHDPYESCESWTCIYTLSLSNDIHFTNCTTRTGRETMVSTSRTTRTGRAKRNMPLYGSYQFVHIGQPSHLGF